VVAFGKIDLGVTAVAALIGEYESPDAGQIALKSEYHQIGHDLQMIAVVLRFASRLGQAACQFRIDRLAEVLDALFEFTDRTEVLVELAQIGGAELAFEPLGVFLNEIENALAIALALLACGDVLT